MDGDHEHDPSRPYHTEKIQTEQYRAPAHEAEPQSVAPASFRRMGMWLLLASLGMLFAAVLVGFLVLRSRAMQWPPVGAPSLPGGLWVSTALLLVLSVVLVRAERAVRGGRQATLNGMLSVSVLLAMAFLVAQVSNWMRMAAYSVLPDENLLVWFFYLLTVLHAAHVLFGLVPLLLITIRARHGRYTVEEHESVHLVGMYWHFLLATWIAIMAALTL
jgi:cytochrome c oxidase subunit 3